MRSVHSESSHEGFTLSVLARRTYPKSPREGADPSVLSAIFDEITKRTYANSNCSKFNPFVLALHFLASSLFHSVKRQTVQIRLGTHVRHPRSHAVRNCACCFPLWKLCRSGRLLRYRRNALSVVV